MNSEKRVKTNRRSRQQPVSFEPLENRRLLHAVIPTGYVALETVQIRPTAGTYTTDLTLQAKTSYFLEATGYTRTSANLFDGDAAYPHSTSTGTTTGTTTTTTSSWGITATVGSSSTTDANWGTQQGDGVYGQTFAPTSTGALSFTWANDGTVKISTLAVTVYAPAPAIAIDTIRTDQASSSIPISALPNGRAYLPVNDADFDHNGVADNKQGGAVVGDQFLLPITLPAITGDSTSDQIQIHVPHGLRIWTNPDRTGSALGESFSVTQSHTLYVEAYAEQPHGGTANLKIIVPMDGVKVVQSIPITVFSLSGPTTAVTGTKAIYSSDLAVGHWLTAVNGTLQTGTIANAKGVSYANVIWGTGTIGYADYDADGDFIWGWPVEITA